MFRKLLSPEAIARIEARQAETLRLYNLGDRWLAEELLKLAREAQTQLWAEGRRPTDYVYDPVFAWHVLPEMAKRLGATSFNAMERTDNEVVRASNDELRLRAAYCLLNCGTPALRDSLLTREAANGNPTVFAMDRLAAPAAEDPVARRLREAAGHRGVECPDGKWTPAFMTYDKSRHSFHLPKHAEPPQPEFPDLDLDPSP